MTMTETVVNEAKSDALQWASAARNRPDSPLSADDLDKERAQQLPSPGGRTASALLATCGWPVVPLDPDTQEPSSGPLTTQREVFGHYRHRGADGAGLTLGTQPGGVVLVAVTGTTSAWRAWCADVATERIVRRDEEGRPVGEERSYRSLGWFSAVAWSPPASPMRTSTVAFGRRQLDELAAAMRPRRAGTDQPGYIVWALPVGDRPVVFPATRALGHGLEVVGAGVVPWSARRADGWTLTASVVPQVEPMPPWLLAALGGRYGKRRSA